MAFSSKLVKERYKDLTIAELEKKYKELEKDFYFKTKENQIKYFIDNYLNASHYTNLNSTKIGLEELLKEKTGNDYRIKTQKFEINLKDIIAYILNVTKLQSRQSPLFNFFNQLTIDEYHKCDFIVCLFLNDKAFLSFMNELNEDNQQKLFEKYSQIAKDYFLKNKRIG